MNRTLCNRLVVKLEKMPVLHKRQFNKQFYWTGVMHNLQFRSAARLSYDRRFTKYIYS